MNRSSPFGNKQAGLIMAAAAAIIVLFVMSAGCSSAPGAKQGDTVHVYYTVSFPGTEPFESNMNGTPLEFTIGDGRVIKGFEEGMLGMMPGETRTFTVPPEKGYGLRNESLVKVVDTKTAVAFVQNLDKMGTSRVRLFPGMEPVFEYTFPENVVVHYTFSNITPESTTIDQNHPLAGKDLVFTITLVDIVKK